MTSTKCPKTGDCHREIERKTTERKVLPPSSNNCIGKFPSQSQKKCNNPTGGHKNVKLQSNSNRNKEKHEYGKQAEIMISCNLILASLLPCGCIFPSAILHLIMCEICDFMGSDKSNFA